MQEGPKKRFGEEYKKTVDRIYKGPFLYEERGGRRSGNWKSHDELDQWREMNQYLKQDIFQRDINENTTGYVKLNPDSVGVQNAIILSMTLSGNPELADIWIRLSPSKADTTRVSSSSITIQMCNLLIDQANLHIGINSGQALPPLSTDIMNSVLGLFKQGLPWIENAIKLNNQSRPQLSSPTKQPTSSKHFDKLREKLKIKAIDTTNIQSPVSADKSLSKIPDSPVPNKKIQLTQQDMVNIAPFLQSLGEFNIEGLNNQCIKYLAEKSIEPGAYVYASVYINWDVQRPLRTNQMQHKIYACDGIELSVSCKVSDLIAPTGENRFYLRLQHQADCASTSWYLHSLPYENYNNINRNIVEFLAAYFQEKGVAYTTLDKSFQVINMQ